MDTSEEGNTNPVYVLYTLTSTKLMQLQYAILNTLTLWFHILDFSAIKSSIQVLCWDSLTFCDKWIYYILHWWSLVVWTTAVINGNMNFADTLYWLQIATTTASNHSSHNSLFIQSAKLIFLTLTSPLSNTYQPNLKLSMFLSLFPHYSKWFSIFQN